MAPLEPGQVAFGSLVMGQGTKFRLKEIRGLSPTFMRLDVDERPDADGAWVNTLGDVEERYILLVGWVVDPLALPDSRQELEDAFSAGAETTFRWNLNAWGAEQSVTCKSEGVEEIMGQAHFGVFPFVASLVAGDPTISPA